MKRLSQRLALTGWLFVSLTGLLHAQENVRTATIDDLMAIKTVMDPQISPNGESIAYVVSVPDLDQDKHNTDIWLIASDGGEAIQLTNNPDVDQHPRWSPDGKSLAFMSVRGGAPQIYLINPRGGEARQLTEAETGVQGFSWSPDGSRIVFLSQEPLSLEVKEAQEDRGGVVVVDTEFQMNHLYSIELKSKETSPITVGEFTVTGFDWSPDGKQIVFARQPTTRIPDGRYSDIYLISSEGGEASALVESPGTDVQPSWSPDGKHIAFVSSHGSINEIGNPTLAIVSARGGKPRRLGEAYEETPGNLVWADDSRSLFFTGLEGVGVRLFSVSMRNDAIASLSPAQEVIGTFSVAADGRKAALIKHNPAFPPEVFASSFPELDGRRLTYTNPQLDEMELGTMEVVRWESGDGMPMEGILLYPVGYQKGESYPLLTYVHGGPSGVFTMGWGPQLGTFPIALQAGPYPLQAFAGEGFAVFMPNPRGSSGYGLDFLRANFRDWGGGDFLDIQTGIDFLISAGIADPDNLGLMGWSYGGYMTSWAISQTDRFKAASVGAGLPNMYSMHGNTDIPDTLLSYFGDRPWNDHDVFDRSSAMRFAGNIVTPTLIQHGEKDERVQLSQAWELYRALQVNEVPTSFAIYPGQGHLIAAPKQQRDMIRRNYEWFKQWVKPKD